MGGGKGESKDWSTIAVANLTDHLLDFNNENSEKLIENTAGIKYETINSREKFLAVINVLQQIVFQSTTNAHTSKFLMFKFNDLIDELTCPLEEYYAPLAQIRWTKVLKALNYALWGAGAFKNQSFFNVLITQLSNVNLVAEKTMIPKKVIQVMKSWKSGEGVEE